MFCPKPIPITGHPSPSPRLGASPSCSFSLSPPSFFFLQLYPPGSLYNRIIRFLSTFCIRLSRGPENLWVRRRDILIEMHSFMPFP